MVRGPPARILIQKIAMCSKIDQSAASRSLIGPRPDQDRLALSETTRKAELTCATNPKFVHGRTALSADLIPHPGPARLTKAYPSLPSAVILNKIIPRGFEGLADSRLLRKVVGFSPSNHLGSTDGCHANFRSVG